MAEAELPTIARPYARAAFSYALDVDGGLAKWSRMLALLAAAVKEPLVEAAIENPMLSADQEAELLERVLGDELDDNAKNFIAVLAEYDRLALLPTVSETFEILKANHEKTIEVDVTSAFEVSDAEATQLSDVLKAKLQRDVNLHTAVDKNLLGGVVIRAEDNVFDNSVRGKLAKLAQVLN